MAASFNGFVCHKRKNIHSKVQKLSEHGRVGIGIVIPGYQYSCLILFRKNYGNVTSSDHASFCTVMPSAFMVLTWKPCLPQERNTTTPPLTISVGERYKLLFKPSPETDLRWVPHYATDVYSRLVYVRVWYRQKRNQCLSQCWRRSMVPYGGPRPQRVGNKCWKHNLFQ